MTEADVHADVIDMLQVTQIMIDKWWILIVVMILGAVAGAGFTASRPDAYEATATVVVASPNNAVGGTTVAGSTVSLPDAAWVEDHARSSQIREFILSDLPAETVGSDRSSLGGILDRATVARTGNFITLTIYHPSQEVARELVESWAEAVVSQTVLLAQPAPARIQAAQEEANAALMNWRDAQEELARFDEIERIDALRVRVQAERDELASFWQKQNVMEALASDLDRFQRRVDALPPDEIASIELRAVSLELNLRALETPIGAASEVGSSFTVQSADDPRTINDLRFQVDQLQTLVQRAALGLETDINKEEQALSQLVGKLASIEAERDRLSAAVDRAREVYTALASAAEHMEVMESASGQLAFVAFAGSSTSRLQPISSQMAIGIGALVGLGVAAGSLLMADRSWLIRRKRRSAD